MRFAIIRPKEQRVDEIKVPTDEPPYKEAGLAKEECDHGRVLPRVGIIVYEYSLYVPAEQQAYFSIGSRLYAGNAVLYSFDMKGKTRDFESEDRRLIDACLVFFNSHAEVEQAIEAGALERPAVRVDGETLWQWPAPAPKGMRP